MMRTVDFVCGAFLLAFSPMAVRTAQTPAPESTPRWNVPANSLEASHGEHKRLA